MNRRCITHHYGHEKYSNVKEINENNENRIKSAKSLREKLKGENHHEEQCVKIPDVIDESIDGIHITPCYNKFTFILSRDDEEKKKNF